MGFKYPRLLRLYTVCMYVYIHTHTAHSLRRSPAVRGARLMGCTWRTTGERESGLGKKRRRVDAGHDAKILLYTRMWILSFFNEHLDHGDIILLVILRNFCVTKLPKKKLFRSILAIHDFFRSLYTF